ncbi:hypothetical protein ACN20G_36870 (plasmid) [Streptomyces sp. BI20]|uniref:hypothetical protein n=1 Tax=Streptomyces sp. BI20 TaxID=3403460 RepID=UPI003C77DED1
MFGDLLPLDIDGITGNYETADAEFKAAMTRWRAAHPDATGADVHDEGMRLVALTETVARYVEVRYLLAEEETAREARDDLLDAVETRWDALTTANAWHAAHHAYVCAVDEARIAIDMWRERAAHALRRPFFTDSWLSDRAYIQIQAAGHQPLRPAMDALDPEPQQTAETMTAVLDQAHTYRLRLTAPTLTATAPQF